MLRRDTDMNRCIPNPHRFGLLCTTAFLTMALITGCDSTQQHQTLDKICLPQTDQSDAMLAAEDILAKMHFTIDKADSKLGIITTRPLSSAQFFEFWRSDVVGIKQALEANIHTTRRIVKVNFAKDAQDLCIDCTVSVYRLTLPEYLISSSAKAYTLFSTSTQHMQTLEPHKQQKKDMVWTDTGKDPDLAMLILDKIKQQLGVQQKDSI